MGLWSPESVAEYVKDYDCLMEGIEFLLNLEQEMVRQGNMEVLRVHYDKHPEDKLCHVYRPGSREIVSCRRSGIQAIFRMAARLVAEAPNGYDLSRKRIAEIISERVLQVGIDNITDDFELVRVLKTYVGVSECEHVETSYRFPCVLLHTGPHHPELGPPCPDRFALGPVTFQQFPKFVEEFSQAVQRGEKRADEKALELFSKSGETHGWVASVAIPRCAPDVSRARAEEIIEAAINLLKVFVGLRYAGQMRLPHTTPSRNRETCILTDVGNEVKWAWHGRSLEGALVAGDPMAGVSPCTKAFASDLLNMGLSGNRDEATTRLLDALRWFGDGSFEESGGVQIVKWIAALERLTGTKRLPSGITRNFCKRVALLASSLGAGKVEDAYRDAYRAYDLRSDVMHGSRSQDDEHLSRNAGFVHDLTRAAIVGALSMHHLLSARMRDGRVESMGRFYDQMAVQHGALFENVHRKLQPGRPQRNSP
jgi:hypothetical protein